MSSRSSCVPNLILFDEPVDFFQHSEAAEFKMAFRTWTCKNSKKYWPNISKILFVNILKLRWQKSHYPTIKRAAINVLQAKYSTMHRTMWLRWFQLHEHGKELFIKLILNIKMKEQKLKPRLFFFFFVITSEKQFFFIRYCF
jgi:hypothetical protein